MDGDRIIGYLKRLDEAMKHFNVSLPDLLLETSNYSPIDIDWSTYCHQGGHTAIQVGHTAVKLTLWIKLYSESKQNYRRSI